MARRCTKKELEGMKQELKDFIDKQTDKGVIEYLYVFILFGVAGWISK